MRHNRLSIQSGEQIHCRPLLCPEVLCSSPGVYYFCQRYNSSLSPQIFYVLLINFTTKQINGISTGCLSNWKNQQMWCQKSYLYIFTSICTQMCFIRLIMFLCTFECLFCTKLFFHYYFTINKKKYKENKTNNNMCTRIDIFQLISS